VPELALTNVDIIPMIVDLPAPFGPSSAKKSFSLTSRSMPLSAWKPLAYVLVNPRIEIAFLGSLVCMVAIQIPKKKAWQKPGL
jgi:hypothetical protein